MADQILSLIVGKLVDYLAVPVGRQFNYLFRYNGNLEEFRSELNGLEKAGLHVKERVDAAERNGEVILTSVEDWLRWVDKVSDEAKRFVAEEDDVSKCCFHGPLNLKVRYQRSRKAKKEAAKFDRIKRDGQFHAVCGPAPPLQIGSISNKDEFDFESRKSVFKEIIYAIEDDGVKIIGIWGMPGIGKTTLVKRVAKYARDKGLFEEVAMAVVSGNPSVEAIQDQIAYKIGLKFTSESKEVRADQLFQRLRARKKILVILDDIWNSLELNDIGIPYGSQHEGCKIILTSRNRGVCEEMRTGKNFKINLLSSDEALSLFLQKSGVDDPFSEKECLAKKLSEECDRLPIAIVIVAGGLLNKEQFYWDDMLSRLRNFDPDRKLCAIIELSYKNLNREEEKMFFLLCGLFPEDYRISVQVLFEYGMGLDLFERVGNMDEALVRAHTLASSLKSSSLLLDEGSERFVKMHDVIRDFALDIASKGEHAFLVTPGAQWREWTGKTAISLWSKDIKKFPDALECPQLQILMLNCRHPDLQLHDNFFVGMRNLVVLDMTGMKFGRLPQSFLCLENLRTLRLSDCELGDISAIGKLKNLISLSFRYSNMEVLPKEVGELSNLRLLDLSNCRRLKVIAPEVIQNLSQLEVLYMGRNVLWCDGKEGRHPENASLSELIHLSRLMMLEIWIADASTLPDEVLFENLTKFKVSIGNDYLQSNCICLSSRILNLRCHSENVVSKAGIKMLMKRAQHLDLDYISGMAVALPSHLGGYESLKELIVSHCKDVNYILDTDESEYKPETPSLQKLHLDDLPLLKEISRGKIPSLFVSKLKHLSLSRLPSLVHLWQFPAESVALANLTAMEVVACDELKYVFEQNTAKSLLKLKKLLVTGCKNLQAIYLSKEEEQDDVIVFPRLTHLELSDLENLMAFGSKFSSKSILFGKQVVFRALETLDINDLGKLEKIWHIHTRDESFFQLKVLKLRQCPWLLVVFPPQSTLTLRNLEEICIRNCDLLETLFQSDGDPLVEGNEMILLPRLKTLKLSNLPKLTSFLSTTSQNISQTTVIFLALEMLDIYYLEKLEKIWHIHTPVESFFQLKVLNLTKCPQLRVVFPPQSTLILRNLEEIYIENCDSLEILFQLDDFPLAVDDEMILFPRLETLKLVKLPKLTAFLNSSSHNISQATVNFPILKSIYVKGLNSIKNIWHNKVSTKCFGQLRQLHVSECDQLVEVFPCRLLPNLHCLEQVTVEKCNLLEKLFQLDSCSVSETKTMTILNQLEILYLDVLPKLRQIWWTDDKRLWGVKVIFPTMEVMKLCSLHNLESIMPQQLLTSFPKLIELQLESNGHPSSSESLYQCKGFQNLTSLEFYYCHDLKSLLTSSIIRCMVQLQDLLVNQCDSLESIVGETDEEQNLDKVIEFSKLQSLTLNNLPRLASFYTGECALKFPCLNDFSIKDCPQLKTFASMAREIPEPSSHNFVSEAFFGQQVSLGRLKNLKLQQLQFMEEILRCDRPAMSLGELSFLEIENCNKLLKIFPSNLIVNLQNLKWLHVESCEWLEHIFAVEDHPPMLLSNLVELELYDLPNLKQLWWNENTCESFGLPSLRYLTIDTCPALQFVFDPSIANRLDNLRSLLVKNCSSMIEIVPEKPSKKIVFPLLDILHLEGLPRFTGFPSEGQSVEFPKAEVVIENCLNMPQSMTF